mmetsp:Transcript_36942/g.99489  ORF Transcript_36942/g.99489 Transcript_36942/m.99489 type:complete len:255 (-) Transcript_36942:11-775(-)
MARSSTLRRSKTQRTNFRIPPSPRTCTMRWPNECQSLALMLYTSSRQRQIACSRMSTICMIILISRTVLRHAFKHLPARKASARSSFARFMVPIIPSSSNTASRVSFHARLDPTHSRGVTTIASESAGWQRARLRVRGLPISCTESDISLYSVVDESCSGTGGGCASGVLASVDSGARDPPNFRLGYTPARVALAAMSCRWRWAPGQVGGKARAITSGASDTEPAEPMPLLFGDWVNRSRDRALGGPGRRQPLP